MSCRSCAISGTTRNCSDNELNAHVHKTVMHFLLFLVVFLTITHNLKRFGKFRPNSLVLMYICNSNRTFLIVKLERTTIFRGRGLGRFLGMSSSLCIFDTVGIAIYTICCADVTSTSVRCHTNVPRLQNFTLSIS